MSLMGARVRNPLAHGVALLLLALPAAGANAQDLPANSPEAAGPISLMQAERWLLERNHDLQSARLMIAGAEADIRTASEAPNPVLSVGSTMIDLRDGTGTGPVWNKRVDSVIRVDQQFERGGKRRLRERAALAARAAASDSLDDVLRLARMAMTQDYFDLRSTHEALSIANDVLNLQTQSLDSVRYRLKAGGIAQIDVTRLEVEVARARGDVIDAETAHRQAQLTLAHDLSLSGDTTQLEASDAWPELSASPAAGVSAETLVNQRADVRSASDLESQAIAQVDLAKAQQTRDVTVGLQYERYPQPSLSPNSVGFGLSVPLFVRNHYEGELDRARVDARSAHEHLERARLEAALDIENARAALDNAARRLETFQRGVFEQAKSAAQATEYAYTRGALGLTDVLDARREFQAVMLESLSARAAYARALAQWRAATSNEYRSEK